jgi:hypothetical protein
MQAQSDPQELKRLISLKIGNQSILGGYYDNSELIFLISGKEVERHLQEETKECRYQVHIKGLEYHKGVHDKKPVAVVKLPQQDKILIVLDNESPKGIVGFTKFKKL